MKAEKFSRQNKYSFRNSKSHNVFGSHAACEYTVTLPIHNLFFSIPKHLSWPTRLHSLTIDQSEHPYQTSPIDLTQARCEEKFFFTLYPGPGFGGGG